MKKQLKWWRASLLYIAVGGVISAALIYVYKTCNAFHALFDGTFAAPSGAGAKSDQKVAENAVKLTNAAADLSFGLLVFILLLQIFAFLTAILVYRNIRLSTESLQVRIRKMENADLFLDLPLYFGLLGTVSSFIVMTFNPQISRLIAYSSTLIGIIFSVLLRVFIQYPMKQKFAYELGCLEK